MAKLNNNSRAALFALVLTLFLIITIAQSKPVPSASYVPVKAKAAAPAPVCDAVLGVRKGDTCFDIAKNFELSAHDFNCINPNVNCAALFVGQWVCVGGIA